MPNTHQTVKIHVEVEGFKDFNFEHVIEIYDAATHKPLEASADHAKSLTRIALSTSAAQIHAGELAGGSSFLGHVIR